MTVHPSVCRNLDGISMQFSLTRPIPAALLLAGLTTLTACTIGSAGDANSSGISGGNSSGATDNNDATGNTVGAGGSSASTSLTISGVAATGAPLLGARIRVIDSAGKAINLQDAAGNEIVSDSSSTADGSFRLTLAKSARPVLPLLLQARGQDASGRPVVLHSLLASGATIANITPLTDATLAQLLGANPATVLQTASANPGQLTILANATAVTNSVNQIKNIVKANLTAAKITNTGTLDLFQGAFTSNKTGVDLVLEGLRVNIVQDSSGKDVLQLGNKFVRGAEVSIDLASARTELLKTSGGDVTKAVTTTLKATTSPTLTNLETLDSLGSSINALIAQNATAATFTTAPALATYTGNNGRTLAQLAARFAYYAARGYQLSNFQLSGCAEDPIPTKGCTYFGVSALVTDNKGNQVEAFRDVASYSTGGKQWVLSGNGQATTANVYPAAYSVYDAGGAPAAAMATQPNPVVGIEVRVIAATDEVPPASSTATINFATVTVPSGYGIPLSNCGQTTLCVNGVPTITPTGTPVDTLLLQSAKGWVGSSKDGASGAQYSFSITPYTGATFTANAYLPTAVALSPPSRVFPQLDDISTTTPLTAAKISAGTSLSWKKWATANPDLQVFMVKTLAVGSTASGASFEVADIRIPDPIAVPSINLGSTTVTTPALASSAAKAYEVWLGAQDNQGRRFYSKYAITP